MDSSFAQRCLDLSARESPFIVVTLVQREGSVPQDVGSKMVVSTSGREHGTIGGGRVEAHAIQHAAEMLGDGSTACLVHWNLNRDLGMTCGGRVRLFFEKFDAASWSIVIFGAGHVAQALARVLESLPCKVICLDPRRDWIEALPHSTRGRCVEDLPSVVESLDVRSYIVCMTQGHRTDVPILERIAKSPKQFPFVGVIGSKSKAGAIRRELQQVGVATEDFEFQCPVGLPIGKNHPGEIAVSIAAQLLQVRDQHSN